MSKIFNEAKINKLDNPKRRRDLSPEKVLDHMNIEKDDILLDIGTGIGYFSVPATSYVKEGYVIGTDISEKMLTEAKLRYTNFKKENKVSKLELIKVDKDEIPLNNESISKILMVYVFHELTNHKRYSEEIHRVLSKEGEITIVDFSKDGLSDNQDLNGPPLKYRLNPQEIDIILKPNFKKIKQVDLKNNTYLLKYKKL